VSGWINHSFDGDVNVWSDLFIGDVLVLDKSISPVWNSGGISVIVELFSSSFPVKCFDFIVGEIVNVGFNSSLGDVLVLSKSLACWGV